MLFDTAPKTNRKDLYNYESEYLALKRAIKEEKLVVVKGIRRVGKTSLIKVVYSEIAQPKAYIDVRGISPSRPSEWNAVLMGCFNRLMESLDATKKITRFVRGIEVISKVGMFEVGAVFRFPSYENIAESIEKLDEKLRNRNKKAVLFFDEVQITKRFGTNALFSFIYDNTKNITMVITGSEVGVLEEFSGYSSDSPLYGRAKEEIEMKRLPPSQSLEFLTLGFKEIRMKVPENELEDAVENLDGIIGWLTMYGHYRKRMSHTKAMRKVAEEATSITSNEIESFLKNKGPNKIRYLRILKSLCEREKTWKEIKALMPNVTDARLSNYLEQLGRYSFIEKKDGKYSIADPLVRNGLKSTIGR
ncbi:MAG: ATP-binding protein [Candidatus Anstonellales archaeon]